MTAKAGPSKSTTAPAAAAAIPAEEELPVVMVSRTNDGGVVVKWGEGGARQTTAPQTALYSDNPYNFAACDAIGEILFIKTFGTLLGCDGGILTIGGRRYRIQAKQQHWSPDRLNEGREQFYMRTTVVDPHRVVTGATVTPANKLSHYNTYLQESKPLSTWQLQQFWRFNRDATMVFGASLSKDDVAKHLANAWNERHSQRMINNTFGFGGRMRESHAKKLLSSQLPLAMGPRNVLRKDGISKLTYTEAGDWLKRIKAGVPATKPKRIEKLQWFFSDKPDGYGILM